MNKHEKYGYNPFSPRNDWFVYLYINKANQVVYCNNVDSIVNFPNKQLRRYVVRTEALGLFVRYYQLRLHPEALKNVVK